MSDQVFRYNNVEDYLDPYKQGIPVSKKFDTFEDAKEARDILRQENPQYYYNIHHYTSYCIFDRKE